jgi:SNF2 family DNA or RNA helicase
VQERVPQFAGIPEHNRLGSSSQHEITCSWKPALHVTTTSLLLGPGAVACQSAWRADEPRPEVVSTRIDLGGMAGAVSLAITNPKIQVASFRFPEPGAWLAAMRGSSGTPSTPEPSKSADASAAPPVKGLRHTRIKAPGDVVKLQDRLFYVLQPSLEAILGGASLAFPFHPFAYQFEGVAFLYPRHAAILADEMGLGKTMQAITAVRLLLRAGELTNVLLVCPKPLVSNWQREFASWAPEIPISVIEGEQAKRRWQWQQTDMPVKIANYELMHRDRELIGELSLEFDLVVLDEAQRIKNRANTTSQAVCALSRRRSWALTGTPVENSPQDLVGIFEFLAPGYLSDAMKPRRMGRAAADYVLRRTKDKVLADLPPKMFRDAQVELGASQRETYQMAEQEGVLRLTEMGDSATIQHVFELVLRLKQICNFDPASGESSKFERLAADLDEVAASGRKAIIFSQWVGTLETLSGRLSHLSPLVYHGRVPTAQRDEVLEQFRRDPARPVLLLSYGAGGVGLNLQVAEYVFLFDRWWNPAVEDQAINRAHRIGAAGPVTVTRFLTTSTIEERIDQILREKREIFDAIFSDAEPRPDLGLTQSEIFGLFQLRCPSGPIDLAA